VNRAATLLRAMGDRINPIVIKELRQAVQSRFVIGALLVYLLVNLTVIGGFIVTYEGESTELHAGRNVFRVLHIALLGACMVIVPMYAAVRLAFERGGASLDLLYISTIKPAAIIRGKFWAAMILALLIFSTCTPFLTFTYLLRGIDLLSVFFLLATGLLATAGCITFAIFVACLHTNWFARFLLALLLLYALSMAIVGMAELAGGFTLFGVASYMGRWVFWAVTGSGVILVLSAMGMFDVFSVAMVSPRSSNRALRIRIYLPIMFAVNAVVWALWSSHLKSHEPIMIWLIFVVGILCMAMFVAVSERERLSPRITRTIPRTRLLRPVAFLFYTGSAGATAWCVLLAAGSIWFAWSWGSDSSPMRHDTDLTSATEVMAGVFLYAYCYCMTAVLLRVLLFRKVAPYFTGGMALLLMVLGCVAPILIGCMVYPQTWHRGGIRDAWMLGNPYALGDQDFRASALVFLTFWAAGVSLACLPWFAEQANRFRPSARAAAAGTAKTNE
jgi:hypothetical protein